MKKGFKLILLLTFLLPFMAEAQCPNVPEVCDNGIDDDCDGLIDCFDPDCGGVDVCDGFYYGQGDPECSTKPDSTAPFAMREAWRSTVQIETRGTATIGDLDGDGYPEVIAHTQSAMPQKVIYILDGLDGSVQTTIPAEMSGYSQSPSIADINRDGFGEVYFVDKNLKLRAYDHEGNALAGFTNATVGHSWTDGGANSAHPSFADFNGDGIAEIYIGNQVYNSVTGALIGEPTNAANVSQGAVNQNTHLFSAADDVLSDRFCADCSGPELICGNVVYSVNVSTGNITEVSTVADKGDYRDGKVVLADWNGDGELDVIVSTQCCGSGGAIYIWDPRTQDLVTHDAEGNLLNNNPIDAQNPENTQVGLPSIGDFDGDGYLEMAMAGNNELFMIDGNGDHVWEIPSFDVSNMTTATAFDFNGDGSIEVVYRDERNLYIVNGSSGAILVQEQCGSATRTDLPVVADVDADGEAEIVCMCSDVNQGGRGYVRVYESANDPWMPTRRVWNTHTYSPTYVNDDLTIPDVFQNKALVDGQDIYLSQTNLISESGTEIYPSLPDLVVEVDSIVFDDCLSAFGEAYITICNEDFPSLVYDFDISYFDGDPTSGGTLIGTSTLNQTNTEIIGSSCLSTSFSVPTGNYDLYVVVNDDGSDPVNAPMAVMEECDETNNIHNLAVSNCDCTDTDDDGVCDDDDLDDDNDGILDQEECPYELFVSETFNTSGGTSTTFDAPAADEGFQFDVFTLDNSFNLNINGVDLVSGELQFQTSGAGAGQSFPAFESDMTLHEQSGNDAIWQITGDANNPVVRLIISKNGNISLYSRRSTNSALEKMVIRPSDPQFNNINWNGSGNNTVILSQYVQGATNIEGVGYGRQICKTDTDGDGIINSLDTDADGDGCLDAQEGGGSFLLADTDDGELTGGVDADGIPIVATSNGQSIGSSVDENTVADECGCEDLDGDGNCDVDLAVTKTDGVDTYQRDSITTYTIIAKNNGPSPVEKATVIDPIPNGVTDFSWTAILHGTAQNFLGTSGSGGIIDSVDLAVGDSIVYTVIATVSNNKYGDLENVVTISVPVGFDDVDSSNNSAMDIDEDSDPSSCFIMMTDFEDYVNCTGPSYDKFADAYVGNSAWVNSNHTAGLFVHDPGNCTNIINGHVLPHSTGGTAYAGLHSPLNGGTQEVIVGQLPTNLFAGQEYEISFIGVSLLVRNDLAWDKYGEVDFFGIEEGASPILNTTTQKDYTAISAIPEVDHLGTSATIDSRTDWNEYSIKFIPSRNYDRLLLAPRGDFAYVGIDNIKVQVATQSIAVDTVNVCLNTDNAVLPFDITSGTPDQYSIDWNDDANAAGLVDINQTTLPIDSQFVLSGISSLPKGIYKAEVTVTNSVLGCGGIDSIYFVVENCNADAEVTKTDFTDKYFAGATTIYTIVAINNGPADIIGGDVSDPLPAGISAGDVTWTVTTYGGATTAATGVNNGAIADVVNIPASDSIVYTVNIVVPPTYSGDLVNTVIITADNDTFPDNDVAMDTDTKDCNFQAQGTIDSRNAGWVKMGNVVLGVPYTVSPAGGSKTFIPNNGPEQGNSVTTLVYNTGTGNHVSLTRNRYRPNDERFDVISVYDNTPHTWTGLSGVGAEGAPILGFMAFIDQNRNGQFDSGLETYYRDITSLKFTPTTSGELYMAFYDDGVYTDNAGTISISVQSDLESTNIGADTSFCLGQYVTLDGQNPDAASWIWNTGEATQTIDVDTAGEYSVKITSVGGCEAHDTINIKMHDVDVVLPKDTGFCLGESYEVIAQSDSAVVWNWDNRETGQSITVDTTGVYKITVENLFGCADSDSINITVHALPVVTVRDTTVCPGGSGTFEAISETAIEYLWQKEGEGTTQFITDSIVGFYEVIVTDANGCKDTTEAELTIHTPPDVTVNNDTICIGDAATTFTATSDSAISYVWSDNGSGTNQATSGITAGDYTVVIEDKNTCKDTATGVLLVDTLPHVFISDTAICSKVASIDLNAVSTTAVAYDWSGLGAGNNISAAASSAGDYTVLVTDENGCEQTATGTLFIINQPEEFEILGDSVACEGAEIELNTSISVDRIEWRETGESSNGITVDTSGVFSVIATNEGNGIKCVESASKEVEFLPYPEEPIIDEFVNCFVYQKELTLNIATDANVIWEYDRFNSDTTFVVEDYGVYNAELFYYEMCPIETTVEVEEFCPHKLYVPNAFTPTEDGLNDIFYAQGFNVHDFKMHVLNRWGELIFTSEDINIGWDGTLNGNDCQIDVYVYKVKYSYFLESGAEKSEWKVGTVTLMR